MLETERRVIGQIIDAALITRLARLLTDRMLDRILAAALHPHFPRKADEHHDSVTARRYRY